jgi:hypothetical protein
MFSLVRNAARGTQLRGLTLRSLGTSRIDMREDGLFTKMKTKMMGNPLTAGEPSPLQDVIRKEILMHGKPMSVARFMQLGLSHPEHGYYSTKEKIFNKGGDFTTSPEISQMFGESLGIWVVQAL